MIVRQATYSDIPSIMQFIDENWKKGHILSVDREFFEWQYGTKQGLLNAIVAYDKEGILYGIKLYIPFNSYEVCDVMGSLWKTIRSEDVFLGMHLSEEFDRVNIHNFCGGCGLSKKAIKFSKLIGEFTGTMKHYYRLNDLEEYKIAIVNNKYIPEIRSSIDIELLPLPTIEMFKKWLGVDILVTHTPVKDYGYIQHRYYEHPIYTYSVWGIRHGDLCRSVIITREVEYKNARVLKIVDFIGYDEDIIGISIALDKLMKSKNYEYVDFYLYGIKDDIMKQSGMILREDNTNVIPNYFEPFVQENIDLNFSTNFREGFRIYRGDGDQDRPSVPRNK